jgi:hypothetical protein
MGETPEDTDLPAGLKLLRNLVTVLTVVMIGGLITVVAVFVTRFPSGAVTPLPDSIALPDGTVALAFTVTEGWYAVVTDSDEILIFDRASGALRQRIAIAAGE